MKYILVRSFSGFGDRIEHLLCVLHYVLKSKRTLVIDWTDHVWCGNEPDKDFYHYFKLNNVSMIGLKEFKLRFIKAQKSNEKLTVIPEFFKDTILRRSDENDVKYRFADIQDHFRNIIIGKTKDLPYDVVVTTDLDMRNNKGIIAISNLVYKDFIMEYIKKDPNYEFLMTNKFVSVHLRGTDRSIYTEDYRPDLTNFSHHTDKYINNMLKKIPKGTKNILLLSDSTSLISNFLKKVDSNYTIVQTNNEKSSGNIGLHLERCDSKFTKNMELLKDFYFMTNSEIVICDEISRCSLVAKRVCDLKRGRPLE